MALQADLETSKSQLRTSVLESIPGDTLSVCLSFLDIFSLGRLELTCKRAADLWTRGCWEALDNSVKTEERSDAPDSRTKVILHYQASSYADYVDDICKHPAYFKDGGIVTIADATTIVPAMFEERRLIDLNTKTLQTARKYEFFARFADTTGNAVFWQGFVRPSTCPDRDTRYELDFDLGSCCDLSVWPSMKKYCGPHHFRCFSDWYEYMESFQDNRIVDMIDKAMAFELTIIAVDVSSSHFEPMLLWKEPYNDSRRYEFYEYMQDQKRSYANIGKMYLEEKYNDDDLGYLPIFREATLLFDDDTWRLVLNEDVQMY